ncbi:MAG: hypothetical protein ACREGG_02560 [Candidatus Saccharimonadales bacterium]
MKSPHGVIRLLEELDEAGEPDALALLEAPGDDPSADWPEELGALLLGD